jgi:hypothetical protein
MPKQNNKKNGKSNMGSRRKTNKTNKGIVRLANGAEHVFGFPNKLMSKLRYVDTYAVTSTSGSIGKQVLYLNSTFDPDNTGTGHQPLYRDTFAAIYDQYAVVSADVIVTFVSNAATSPMLVGCVVDDDAATSSTINTLCEQSNGQNAMLPNATGAPTVHTFRYHWDCKKILQIDPYLSETYKTAVGSNPTEVSSMLLWAAPADTVSTTTTLIHVELEQTVLWTELTSPVQS